MNDVTKRCQMSTVRASHHHVANFKRCSTERVAKIMRHYYIDCSYLYFLHGSVLSFFDSGCLHRNILSRLTSVDHTANSRPFQVSQAALVRLVQFNQLIDSQPDIGAAARLISFNIRKIAMPMDLFRLFIQTFTLNTKPDLYRKTHVHGKTCWQAWSGYRTDQATGLM